MPNLTPVLTREEIQQRVAATAAEISRDYADADLVLVGVLKGAFLFLADLARALSIPVEIDFLRAASYGNATSSSGRIRLTKPLETDIRGRDVLVVEDIVDTGLTLAHLVDYLNTFQPKSVRVCTLLDKSERREVDVRADYVCHRIAEGFLVGYGLDHAEKYRNLPAIYHLNE